MSTPKDAVVFVDQVLQVEIFLSPGYRFKDEEDGSVYNDGGDLDQFVPQREWPDKPLPEAPEPSISSPVEAPTTVSADRAQLIADLQAIHDATVKSLEAIGVNASEDYMQHKVDTILAKAGPGDTKCQICKKELKSTQNLRAHIISKHMGTKSPYKCQQCEETFGSTYALKLHMRRHSTSSKKYTCRVCTKVYFSIGHYNEHLKVHSGSQFICPWCSKVNSSALGALKFSNTRRILMPINKGPVPNALMTNQLQRGTNAIIVTNHMPTRGIYRPTLDKDIHRSDRYIFHSDCSSYRSDHFVHRSNRSSSTLFTVYYVFHPVLSFLPGCLLVNVCAAF